ncbi:MAG TPA: hypothetical protein VF598_06475, partial [Hymenobacter sp.]
MKRNALLLLLAGLSGAGAFAQTPVLNFPYSEATGTTTTANSVSGASFAVANNFGKPERVPGIAGNALRLDGFSTWVSGTFAQNFTKQLTVETWLNLESYPADAEVPFADLTPSAIVSQFNGTAGYQLGMNTFGGWF